MSDVSLLQNNFLQSDGEASRYVAAKLEGLKARTETANRMSGMIGTLQAQMADAETLSDRVRISKRASAMLDLDQAVQVNKGSELALRQAREHTEEKAGEALESTGGRTQDAASAYAAQASASGGSAAAEGATPQPSASGGEASAPASVEISV